MSLKTFINVAEGYLNYMRFLVSRQGHTSKISKLGEARMEHCVKCIYLRVDKKFGGIPSHGKCLQCGCSFPVFVYAPGKECPIGLWPRMEDE